LDLKTIVLPNLTSKWVIKKHFHASL